MLSAPAAILLALSSSTALSSTASSWTASPSTASPSTARTADSAPHTGSVAILVPLSGESSWRDDAWLCALPAAVVLGEGAPIVLALDASAPWRPELVDFLERYEPSRLFWVGEVATQDTPQSLPPLELLPAATAAEAAAILAATAWPSAPRVVLYDSDVRADALAAAALAGRLRIPLLPCRGNALEAPALAALKGLGTRRALFVGDGRLPRVTGLRVERVKGAEGVLSWLLRHGHEVDYLAAVNPRESVAGRDRHLALVAPLLAVGRSGAVAPLAYDTHWKLRCEAGGELSEAPPGAAPSSAGWRRGELALAQGEAATPFLIGREPAGGRWWLQLDLDRDGRFEGADERALYTGEDLALGGVDWTADLEAVEAERGRALWLTSPTAAEIRADLERFGAAAGGRARYLCLIGWPTALPMAVIAGGQGIDADLVSDLPLGQTDADPFVEWALARFIAEDLPAATLLACRGLVRDELSRGDGREGEWRTSFATAEWEGVCRGLLEGAGLRFLGHHEGAAPIDSDSPLAGAGLILHGSHASWAELGATYRWDSRTLLAPALVDSSGCSTASLDQDPEQHSVAARMLRNGAVAFVGNTRRGIAQQELFRSELWNALLAGATLGEAQRSALNKLIVVVLEKGESAGGPYYYQLYNHAVYGDPALQLGLELRGAERPAYVEARGKRVTVHAPERWRRFEYAPLEEWGCALPRLYTWRGAGAGVESSWYGPQKRNEDTLYVSVELRTERRVTGVEPLGEVAAPLGWSGVSFVDLHADGSRSLYWRVRMIDADMTTGELRARVDELEFRLRSD